MKNINFIFYGILLFILTMIVVVFYFFGSKFLEKENDLVGRWKIERMSSAPLELNKNYTEKQKQTLIQRDSILHSKVNSLFLDFKTSSFIFKDTNNGKLETNFFETDKPISWHYSKEKNQIALYRKKEPDIFWEIKMLSDSTLKIITAYGSRKWIIELSKE